MMSKLILGLCCFLQYVKSDTPPDTFLNFTQIGTKYGYECEEHDVVTEDNYILKTFRLVGDQNKIPILMGHGLLGSADLFILRGKSSPAGVLATAGYDIWVLNIRGNNYSRRHKTLNPDKDNEFWDFSFHDVGVKDLTANIDYVLKKTNKTQLVYIGQSQGTQICYVMGSIRPEYNDKVKVYISLAPIAYLSNLPKLHSTVAPLWPVISGLYKVANQYEIFNKNSILVKGIQATCTHENKIEYKLCSDLMSLTMGPDSSEIEPEFQRVVAGHVPSSTSRKNLDHTVQGALRKKFAQYDYGLKNFARYGALHPKEYPLHKISSPVVLIVGRNDKFSTVKDVKLLYAQLPNAFYHEVQRDEMNHADFLIGKNMKDYLFPIIFEALQNHTQTV